MFLHEVVLLAGVGDHVEEFQFAALAVRVMQFPLAFADRAGALRCAGFPEKRFGAHVLALPSHAAEASSPSKSAALIFVPVRRRASAASPRR